MSRAERQRRTRASLLDAGRLVFARDGFHAASLDGIAREAGFSKGAVYSNFDSKADLFLAILDSQLEEHDDGDPTSVRADAEELAAIGEVRFDDPPTELQLSRGFGLATLEFASSAGRDPELSTAFRERIGALVTAYTRVAAQHRTDAEPLSDDELAVVLTAFDQGYAVLALVGWPIDDHTVMQRALRRLLRPAPDEGVGGA